MPTPTDVQAIILAAGYATRLYPLTFTRPKPLLPVNGRPILERVLEKLAPIEGLRHAWVVTNQKFAPHFETWAGQYRPPRPDLAVTIVNDQSTGEDNKLGAIGDLHFVLQTHRLDSDLVVVAGDNLFSESLGDFGRFCRAKAQPVLGVYEVANLEEIKKYNAITLDPHGRITHFEEKPRVPQSRLTGIALYYYPRSVLPLIRQYVREERNHDQPGRLVQWLYPRVPFLTWRVPGRWFDIGSLETLQQADQIWAGLERSVPDGPA